MLGWSELDNMWKEGVVAYFKALARNLPGCAEEYDESGMVGRRDEI
jgi:hypothetical protein